MPSKPAPPGRSTAVEDYLEQILDLINTKGYARVADIAQGLRISQASVTNMVQRLDAEGLLKYEKYRGLVLTTAGAYTLRASDGSLGQATSTSFTVSAAASTHFGVSASPSSLTAGDSTAVSVAALTLYDMVKAVDKAARIDNVRVLRKDGGRSGSWAR